MLEQLEDFNLSQGRDRELKGEAEGVGQERRRAAHGRLGDREAVSTTTRQGSCWSSKERLIYVPSELQNVTLGLSEFIHHR